MGFIVSEDCGHLIEENRFTVIRLPRFEEDGTTRAKNPDGTPGHSYVRMPKHAVPQSRFDPYGLVPALCDHGLRHHPDPEIDHGYLARLGKSWMASRYVRILGFKEGMPLYACPVCAGEPAPEDLTNGYTDAPEAEAV